MSLENTFIKRAHFLRGILFCRHYRTHEPPSLNFLAMGLFSTFLQCDVSLVTSEMLISCGLGYKFE